MKQKFIILLAIILTLPVAFAVDPIEDRFIDLIPPSIEYGSQQAEGFFPVGNGNWGAVTGGGSQQWLTIYDGDFNAINGSPLEHFNETSPAFLFNSDGAYNGSHYFVIRRNVATNAVYVYDSDFQFVNNITASLPSINAINWNGSHFLLTSGQQLVSSPADLQSFTTITTSLPVETIVGGIAQVGEALYVAEQNNAGSNVTKLNTSNGYVVEAIYTGVYDDGTFITALGANESNVIIHTGNGDNELLDSNLNVIDEDITFDIQSGLGGGDPRDVTKVGNTFYYIVDSGSDNNIYSFNEMGTTGIIANLNPLGATATRGLASDGTNLFVGDDTTDTVYEYTTNGLNVANHTLAESSSGLRGASYNNVTNTFWLKTESELFTEYSTSFIATGNKINRTIPSSASGTFGEQFISFVVGGYELWGLNFGNASEPIIAYVHSLNNYSYTGVSYNLTAITGDVLVTGYGGFYDYETSQIYLANPNFNGEPEEGVRVFNYSPIINQVNFCGDGFLDFGETCDDGGTASGDGCSATCQIEAAAEEEEEESSSTTSSSSAAKAVFLGCNSLSQSRGTCYTLNLQTNQCVRGCPEGFACNEDTNICGTMQSRSQTVQPQGQLLSAIGDDTQSTATGEGIGVGTTAMIVIGVVALAAVLFFTGTIGIVAAILLSPIGFVLLVVIGAIWIAMRSGLL